MSKISNLVGRNDNFPAKAQKLSILPTMLDISVILRQPLHLSMVFWKSFSLYPVKYSFQATGYLLSVTSQSAMKICHFTMLCQKIN